MGAGPSTAVAAASFGRYRTIVAVVVVAAGNHLWWPKIRSGRVAAAGDSLETITTVAPSYCYRRHRSCSSPKMTALLRQFGKNKTNIDERRRMCATGGEEGSLSDFRRR